MNMSRAPPLHIESFDHSDEISRGRMDHNSNECRYTMVSRLLDLGIPSLVVLFPRTGIEMEFGRCIDV